MSAQQSDESQMVTCDDERRPHQVAHACKNPTPTSEISGLTSWQERAIHDHGQPAIDVATANDETEAKGSAPCPHSVVEWRFDPERDGSTEGWWECSANCGARFDLVTGAGHVQL